jgi:hypothetical protein
MTEEMMHTIQVKVPHKIYLRLVDIKGKGTWLELLEDVIQFDEEINGLRRK